MSKFKLCAFADEAGTEIEKQIRALKDNQISLIELRGVNGNNISELTIEQAKKLKRQLNAKGIQVWSIGSPIGKIQITDAFEPHMQLFLHTLEIAQIMESSCIRLFSFYIPKNTKPSIYREEVLQRLNEFSKAAEGSGVTLCHENEKDIYGDNAERCLEILKEVKGLKGIFDPANFIQCGQDICSAWELLSPYIHYIHIKDCKNNGLMVPAGEGDGQIPFVLKKWADMGAGILTIEPHLAVFKGLDKLENNRQSIINPYCFKSQREAFDTAVHALKKLI